MSQDFKLFSYNKVPFNKISFDKPSQNIDGQYFSKGFYKNTRRIQIETTYLYTNSGIIHKNNKQSYINFMFDSRHENKNKTQDFMKCINNFDQLIIDNIYSNRYEWGFTDNDTDAFSIDAIRDQYLPTIKPDFKGHNPIMKIWIRDIDKLPIYDDDKQPVQNKTIHKHYSCRAIIELEGIQFRKDSVLSVWKVVVLKINKQQLVRQDKGYIFNDNSDFEYSSEEEEEEKEIYDDKENKDKEEDESEDESEDENNENEENEENEKEIYDNNEDEDEDEENEKEIYDNNEDENEEKEIYDDNKDEKKNITVNEEDEPYPVDSSDDEESIVEKNDDEI